MNFKEFQMQLLYESLIEESKNDPMPEITNSKSGTFLAVIGPSASGKTTFISKYVQSINDWKIIDPDKMNYILSSNKHAERNYSSFNPKTSAGFTKLIGSLLSNPKKPNIIFDNTGSNFKRNISYIEQAKALDWNTAMVIVLNQSSKIALNNLQRSVKPIKKTIDASSSTSRALVDTDYILDLLGNFKELMYKYKNSDSIDNMYVVINIDNGKAWKFLKFDTDDTILTISRGVWTPVEDIFNSLDAIESWFLS
jgi:predicted kinase